MLYDLVIENSSTPTSLAPGTDRNDGGRYPSKARSAYAKSCTTIRRCSRANSTTLTKKSRSTHSVVGLWGKDRIRSFAFGHARRVVSWRRAKKSSPACSGTERRSASAMTTEYEWIG